MGAANARNMEARDLARAVYDRLGATWNAGDADAFAAVFAADADVITIVGKYAKGSAEIAAVHAPIFAGPYRGSVVTWDVQAARQVAAGLVHAVAYGTVVIPAGPMAGSIDAVNTLLIAVGDDGPHVVAFQNTRR
jgi:uncharacterized protein (TIGR02246 family)